MELAEDEKLTDDMKIFVSETSFDELQQFDYGFYKGPQYAGIKMLTLKEMLDFCQTYGVAELYIEIKDGTREQINNAVALTKEYGLIISWAASTYEQAKWVIDADEHARISLMPYNIDDPFIEKLLSLQTGKNEVFIFAYGNAILNSEIVDKLSENNIAFEMGTINSEKEIINYWNGAYRYCSEIESDIIVASDIDIDRVLGQSNE